MKLLPSEETNGSTNEKSNGFFMCQCDAILEIDLSGSVQTVAVSVLTRGVLAAHAVDLGSIMERRSARQKQKV